MTDVTGLAVEKDDHRTDRILKEQINKALEGGKYFVTVSILDGKEITHRAIAKSFPRSDILPTLAHLLQKTKKDIDLGNM